MTSRTRPYQKLIVWKEAHLLCLFIYSLTKKFPADERFALVDQMRRSSSSVPTNIAEGSGKSSIKDKDRFLKYAVCSLEELHYQCFLSRDLSYCTGEDFEKAEDHINRTGFLLANFRKAIY